MPGYFAKNEQHRRLVLKALLWITLSGGLFFSVVNLLHDNWLLAGLEIGYAAVSLYLLTIIDKTRNLQLLTAIYLLPFFSIMIVALAQTTTTFAVFAWIQTIPIICYLLLGLRLGCTARSCSSVSACSSSVSGFRPMNCCKTSRSSPISALPVWR
nr:hypothetical protein [Pseudomonas mendocina]